MLSESGCAPDESATASVIETPASRRSEEAPLSEETPSTKPGDAPGHTPWWLRRYTFTGTAVGLVFLWLSTTPSLLPRGPLFQGLVSGVSGAVGYAVGVFAV